jgi:hypothetical protein
MSDSLTIWLLQTDELPHIDSGNPWPMQAMNLAEALSAGRYPLDECLNPPAQKLITYKT